MPKTQTDYSNTIIYKLCCKDPTITEIYIGHTTNFTQRKNSHKTLCCNENNKNHSRYVYQFIRQNGGWNNWNMIQIEKQPFKNKREAEAHEHCWIEKLNALLNSNKPHAMCKEEPKKYKQDWYENNKDTILQKAKEQYEENKEEKIKYQKQYAEENKENVKSYQDEYREKNKTQLYEQKKIYRGEHKEEAKKASKEWREANKEKIKQQKSQIINCECGCQYTFGNKCKHLQSKIHIDYQNKLSGIVESCLSEEEKLQILHQKQKEYREKNAEKIKENKKKYNEENKKQIKEQTHNYYQEHKEEIKLKTKHYVKENKEKVKKYMDSRYLKNKEKILEKQKQIFICECGSQVRCAGKSEHLRSIKHNNYIDTLVNIHEVMKSI
jgi:hypothetical protein